MRRGGRKEKTSQDMKNTQDKLGLAILNKVILDIISRKQEIYRVIVK